MSRGTYITLMTAHKIHTLKGKGYSIQQIADEVGCTRQRVSIILKGGGLEQQRAHADRAEYFLGGILGPDTGNTRRGVVTFHDDQLAHEHHSTGVHELTSPDPLDILIALEEVEEHE